MNWDQIEGKWDQAKGKVKEKWGKLTDDDIAVINGKRDQLAGRIQERYGYTKEQVEDEMKAWERDTRWYATGPARAGWMSCADTHGMHQGRRSFGSAAFRLSPPMSRLVKFVTASTWNISARYE